MKRALILALLLTLSACASTQRYFTYPGGMPDADVHVGGYRYQVWFHPSDQTIWMQRGDPRPMSELTALNTTRYAANPSQPEEVWRAAANAVLFTIHCEATQITGADQMREAGYVCGPGVDVNGAIEANRANWQRGIQARAPG
jgi:hypothetical protein